MVNESSKQGTVIVFGDTIPPDYQGFCHRNNLRPLLASSNGKEKAYVESLYDVISLDDFTQADMEHCRVRLGISSRATTPLEILADKNRSKALSAIAQISPDWFEVSLQSNAIEAAKMIEGSFGYPCVLKPSNGLYSAGVIRVDSADDVDSSWLHILTVARAMKRKRGFGTIIAERFIGGTEFMIDGFRCDGEDFFLTYHQKWPQLSGPTFHEIACISRGIRTNELIVERKAISGILNGLGLNNTPFHAEFRRSESGEAFLLELAPRLGGGGTSSAEMLRITSGLSSYDILHSVNRGCFDETMVQPKIRRWALEYDFFVSRSGRLKNLAKAEEFCWQAGASSVFCYANDGDYRHKPPMNMSSFLTAFFEIDSYQHAIEKINNLGPIETD